MHATYQPSDSPTPIHVELDTINDFQHLWQSTQTGRPGGLNPAIELTDAAATTLLFARAGDTVALMIADDDHSYHWIDPTRTPQDPAVVEFSYRGAHTEVPCHTTTSPDQAQAIVDTYWHAGFTQALAQGHWEQDW